MTPEWIWPPVDLASLPEPPVTDSPIPVAAARYRRLHEWFASQQTDSVELRGDLLNELVDGGIPESALTGNMANEWWSNNPRRGHSRAWLNAGFVLDRSASDLAGVSPDDTLIFLRQPRRVESRAEMVQRRLFWLHHIAECGDAAQQHINDHNDRPTGVYLIRALDSSLLKVGVSVNIPARIKAHNSHGRTVEVMETLHSPHRKCAYLVESVALNMTEQWRVLGGFPASSGGSEAWSADGPVPDLAALAHRINPTLDWRTSV